MNFTGHIIAQKSSVIFSYENAVYGEITCFFFYFAI